MIISLLVLLFFVALALYFRTMLADLNDELTKEDPDDEPTPSATIINNTARIPTHKCKDMS